MWIVRLEGLTNHFQIILILKALFSVLSMDFPQLVQVYYYQFQ